MDNFTVMVRNNSKEEPMTELIGVSSFGVFGGLAAILNLLLICFQLTGFKKRKAYEYILFAITVVGFINSFSKCCIQTYAITSRNDIFCKYGGLLTTILTCSAMMLMTVNMLHRYLSLYYPIVAKKISTNPGIVICTTLPILTNIACYTPLLLFDVFGRDALGTCTMKAFTSNNKWIMLSGVELFACNIANIMLGLSVIWKIGAHSSHVQKLFKSQLVNESKQIVKLMTFLTIGPMINYTIGFVMRLLPPEMVATVWLRYIPLIITPVFFVMTPVIMIVIIKDYKKNFMQFLSCATSQVVPVKSTDLNTEKKIELIGMSKNVS